MDAMRQKREAHQVTATHFLVITEESYDCSIVHGIYDTFEAASDDTDRRTAADLIADTSMEYISNAQIQEWTGDTSGRTWERSGVSTNWVQR